MSVTVGIYFDNRMSKEGEYYVKYVVYSTGKQRYYSTGIKLNANDVEFLKKYKSGLTAGVRDPYKRNLWNLIYGQQHIDDNSGKTKVSLLPMATKILGQLGPHFTFEKFKELIGKEIDEEVEHTPLVEANNILADLQTRAEEHHQAERFSEEDLCRSAAKSFARFTGKTKIRYEEINLSFLKKYEKWMLKEGRLSQKKKDGINRPASITTVGIYLRAVRSVFKDWVRQNPVLSDLNPFGEGGYVIPAALNIKKALSKDDITRIIQFQAKEGNLMGMSRDLWVFSYLSNGINFADLLELKWKDVDSKNNIITFVRQKTSEKKKSKQNKAQIDMFRITWEIIERWGNPSFKEYLFPFYLPEMTSMEKLKIKRQAIKNTNKWMKVIADALEINSDVNTYSARHSFATILLQSEAPLAFISQKLDHASIQTTQKYLGSFEDKQVKKYLNALLPIEKSDIQNL